MMVYLFKNYNKLKVAYLPELDGGGSETYKEFIVIVKKTIGKVDRICEFCAGPSFIGFSLLAEGLCNSLCLVDINPEAIKAIQETIKLNNLQDKVTVYQSDGLSNVPDTEKWDLVVSNPPHFHAKTQEEYKQNIILKDFKWSIHKNFFEDVSNFLKPHSTIIMQECYMACEENDFLDFLEKGNLKLSETFMFKKPDKQWRDVYYYLVIKNQHNNFIGDEHPVNLVKLNISEIKKQMKLKSWNKYRFEISNDLDDNKTITLLNGADKNGKDIKVFETENISPSNKKQSNIFYLTPGSYDLVDYTSKKLLSKIEVKQ
jgi:methylase of polypeptide subunit release factors